MNICIDGVLSKVTLSDDDALEMVVIKKTKTAKCELKSLAFYEVVNNHDNFILTTSGDRSLYLKSFIPPGPAYSHGGCSVSSAAQKGGDRINQYCKVYNL